MARQNNQIDTNLNATIFDFYRFNLHLGLKKIKKKEGIKKIIKGIDYFGYLEYPLVFNNLEHIPNDGESIAAKGMSRVLKRGEIMDLTVPYGSFEEDRQQHVSYFQRVYNEEDIYERLTEPSGLVVERIEYFCETKYNFTKYWQKIPSLFLIPFLWARPIFSKLF